MNKGNGFNELFNYIMFFITLLIIMLCCCRPANADTVSCNVHCYVSEYAEVEFTDDIIVAKEEI